MITIRVVSKSSGKPVSHTKVHLSFGGDWFGTWLEEYTNSDGDANFSTEPKTGKVIVSGSERYSGHLSGRVVVYS